MKFRHAQYSQQPHGLFSVVDGPQARALRDSVELASMVRHPCHTTTDDPGPCSWGSPSDPACTGCVKRG